MSGPQIRLMRGTDGAGWWEFAVRRGSPALAGHIRSLIGYREHSPTPVRRRVFPTGELTLIVSFGPSVDVDGVGAASSFVAGLDTAHAFVTYTGAQYGVEVNLDPAGVAAVCGCPAGELTGQVVDLADLWGAAADRLADELAQLPDWAARFDAVERFLERRVADGPALSPAIAWALRRLRSTGGRIAIADLVDELGCSHRYLTTRFREQVGLPPKLLGRVLRFHHAMTLRQARPDTRLADLAVACGYYDEAHLHRDFREFAGLTPQELTDTAVPLPG